MKPVEEYKPAVPGTVLVLLAGTAWICVGIMLLIMAAVWLAAASNGTVHYDFAVAGVVLALLIHHFGFLKIVNSNLERILPADGKRCVFAFIPWKSYLIIAVMVAMGITLRHSAIPRQYLAICYIGIGLALVLSSIRYMRIFFREVIKVRST
ncbi:MAG: hypothetical protein SWH61_01840 [Thermodesulfobacteriota bacterium]|nr:hypothetical protein [Thermodesulfobacteriota bacterium]